MIFRVSACIVLLLMVFCHTGFSDEFSGYKSRWPVVQNKAIATDESIDYVFVGDGDTINVFRKTDLFRVAFIRLSDTSQGVRALEYHPEKRMLYAACGHSGVQIIDVADPLSPTTETTIPIKRSFKVTAEDYYNGVTSVIVNAYDLAIHGDYLYVADFDYGLRIYAIAPIGSANTGSSANPEELNGADLKTTKGKYALRNIALYSENDPDSFCIIVLMNAETGYPLLGRLIKPFNGDGTTPAEYSLDTPVGLLTLMGASSLVVKGNYVYCLDEVRNLFIIFDFQDKSERPVLVYPPVENGEIMGRLYLGQPRSLAISGNYAYIATHYRYTLSNNSSVGTEPGLHIFDISDPYNPIPMSGIGHKVEGANCVAVSGDSVYMTSHSAGLHRMNVSFDDTGLTVAEPVPASSTAFNVSDVTIVNNELLYLVDNIDDTNCGLNVVRIKSDKITTSEEVVTGEGDGEEEEESETVVYQDEIPATPGYPLHEAFMATPGQAKDVCVGSMFDYGYIADGHAGLQFITYESLTGYTRPILVPESNVAAPVGYEVVRVAIFNKTLFALTTDPAQELWVTDVTAGTSIEAPSTYSPIPFNLPGDATAIDITAYGPYAMIPSGENGLVIVDTQYGDENTGEIALPPEGSELVVPAQNALAVFADPDIAWPYAFLADKAENGSLNIHTVRLYQETNIADMAPEIISSFTLTDDITIAGVSDMTTIRSLHYYDGSLYIVTDSNSHTVIILNMADVEAPVVAGHTGSYGAATSIRATTVVLNADLTNRIEIKGTYLADGPGGVSIMQLSDNPDSGYPEREWADDGVSSCFITSPTENRRDTKTGLFPMILFGAACLTVVILLTCIIHVLKKRS